jgi:hypothetical protein
MEKDSNITSNWILEGKLTETFENRDKNEQIFDNLKNEISFKAKDIDGVYVLSESENASKKVINLDSLPLYFPQEISARRISATLNHTLSTQRWRGYVLSKNDKKFKAKLEDITSPGTYEIGTFDIQDKDLLDEKEMIQIGAVFYLSIGYDVSRGTYSKQKLIRFQRLKNPTEKDFNNAIDRAQRIADNLNWE